MLFRSQNAVFIKHKYTDADWLVLGFGLVWGIQYRQIHGYSGYGSGSEFYTSAVNDSWIF